jgi:hypothetical protein
MIHSNVIEAYLPLLMNSRRPEATPCKPYDGEANVSKTQDHAIFAAAADVPYGAPTAVGALESCCTSPSTVFSGG